MQSRYRQRALMAIAAIIHDIKMLMGALAGVGHPTLHCKAIRLLPMCLLKTPLLCGRSCRGSSTLPHPRAWLASGSNLVAVLSVCCFHPLWETRKIVQQITAVRPSGCVKSTSLRHVNPCHRCILSIDPTGGNAKSHQNRGGGVAKMCWRLHNC